MARKKPWIRDRTLATWIGYGGILIGALALYDAYENRGRQRPLLTKFLPT